MPRRAQGGEKKKENIQFVRGTLPFFNPQIQSAPGHLHTAPSFCRAHGNVTHGGPAGALVSSPYSTRSTECPTGSPLGQGS